MDLIDYHGVPVAFVDVAEALATDWHHLAGSADVVRVEEPPRDQWPALRACGFLPKPQFVTWLADAGDSEEAYMARLTSGERQRIRAARRQLTSEGLELSVHDLDEPLLEEFLLLYKQSIDRMRHGVSVAHEEKDTILAERESYLAVCVHDGATLVGCCLVRREQAADTVRVRFSAVDVPRREASLARVLYMRAAGVAREAGLRTFSLGKDRNLYGHIAKPGLLRFKRQLGLAPQPSHLVDPAIGHNQADLVLGLGSMTDPSMLLSYDEGEADRLRLVVFSEAGEVDLRPFAAKFPGGTATVLITSPR